MDILSDPCDPCNKYKKGLIDKIDNNIDKAMTNVTNIINKNVNILSILEKYTDYFLKGIYIIIFISLFLILLGLILQFLFNVTIVNGISTIVSIITLIITIVIVIFMLSTIIINFLKGEKFKNIINNKDDSSIFILIKTLISCMYFLVLFILVAMPFGFLLSISYFFGTTFHTNVIDRFYSFVMILSIIVIFFIFILP